MRTLFASLLAVLAALALPTPAVADNALCLNAPAGAPCGSGAGACSEPSRCNDSGLCLSVAIDTAEIARRESCIDTFSSQLEFTSLQSDAEMLAQEAAAGAELTSCLGLGTGCWPGAAVPAVPAIGTGHSLPVALFVTLLAASAWLLRSRRRGASLMPLGLLSVLAVIADVPSAAANACFDTQSRDQCLREARSAYLAREQQCRAINHSAASTNAVFVCILEADRAYWQAIQRCPKPESRCPGTPTCKACDSVAYCIPPGQEGDYFCCTTVLCPSSYVCDQIGPYPCHSPFP